VNAERLQELREQTERLSEFSVFGSMVQGELSALVDMALAHFHEEYPYDCECFNSGQTQAEEYAKRHLDVMALEAERLRTLGREAALLLSQVEPPQGHPYSWQQEVEAWGIRLRSALAGTEANVDRLTEVIEREGWEDTKR
jgi:hypothetical protein